MTLTPLEVEALFVRHEAAMGLRKNREVEGWEALALVLMPSQASLEASLKAANDRGVTNRSYELAKSSASKKKRKPYGPRRWRSGELLAASRNPGHGSTADVCTSSRSTS